MAEGWGALGGAMDANGFPSNHNVMDEGALIQRCQPARPVQRVRSRTDRKQTCRGAKNICEAQSSDLCYPASSEALPLQLLPTGAKVLTHSGLSPKGTNWILLSLKNMLSRLHRQVVLIHGEQILWPQASPGPLPHSSLGSRRERSKLFQCVTPW